MRRLLLGLLLLALGLPVAARAEADPFAAIGVYDASAHSQKATECDRLAAHPNDPDKVAAGVEQSAMDIPAAIAACSAAVKADPANPRLNYQLARAYGYAGRHAEGEPFRRAALNAGYPQSLFVIGYIRLSGWDGAPADPCYGGELIRRSALSKRLAGLLGFPHYALSGKFAGCASYPRVDGEELAGFLAAARAQTSDYYHTLLIEQLEQRFLDRKAER